MGARCTLSSDGKINNHTSHNNGLQKKAVRELILLLKLLSADLWQSFFFVEELTPRSNVYRVTAVFLRRHLCLIRQVPAYCGRMKHSLKANTTIIIALALES